MTEVRVHSAHLTHPDIGTIRLWATDRGLRRLDLQGGPDLPRDGETLATASPPAHLATALHALRRYLDGEDEPLDLPLDLTGATDFQARVYERLRAIPRGSVTSYGQVAADLGMAPGAARAVGQAVGANPVAIVIPCHRVVASDGTLHGFSAGLRRKAALLRIEGLDVDGVEARSHVHPDVLSLPL